ncbi:MAG TPA: DUF2087 domain-containing protein [Anaerovoracaceae bacterium]|nr:DUF2087 domain-containing protein [Anaerovoracaceae bacterium]
MCTIIVKDHFIGKNYDSVVNEGMIFTNKRSLIKEATVFPPDQSLEWVSSYGSVTFSQSGREMPVGGVNEAGLVVEQATLPATVYPESEGKPAASSLEATQYLLDTCGDVTQALAALERIAITKTSWPIHFALIDSGGRTAAVEYLRGCKQVYEGTADRTVQMTNTGYQIQDMQTECRSADDMFACLEKSKKPDTVWSHVYDLRERKLFAKRSADSETVAIELDWLDFSPWSESQMLDIKEGDTGFRAYTEEANRRLISGFFNHPVIGGIMKLPDSEAMIDFIAVKSKNYDRINEIVLRFLEEGKIKQIPVRMEYKIYVLKYLTSKFEMGKEYSERQVNAVIDEWHTFGDYFVLRRELIDSGLMKRLPNGSKYWRA